MMKFTYETQDDSKFLVYEKTTADVIDTMALGMLSNNMIEGIVPFIYAQADDTVYMKYNISGLASLEECCTGVLRRKKVLDILGSFAEAVAGAEEYMLESSSFVLELPHIFVDPSDNRVSLIVLPIEREEVPLAVFLRNLVIGMQYDQRENGNYIAALINFFNSDKAFSVHEFQALVQKLKEEGVDQAPERIPGQYHIGYQEAAATSQPSVTSRAGTAAAAVIWAAVWYAAASFRTAIRSTAAAIRRLAVWWDSVICRPALWYTVTVYAAASGCTGSGRCVSDAGSGDGGIRG